MWGGAVRKGAQDPPPHRRRARIRAVLREPLCTSGTRFGQGSRDVCERAGPLRVLWGAFRPSLPMPRPPPQRVSEWRPRRPNGGSGRTKSVCHVPGPECPGPCAVGCGIVPLCVVDIAACVRPARVSHVRSVCHSGLHRAQETQAPGATERVVDGTRRCAPSMPLEPRTVSVPSHFCASCNASPKWRSLRALALHHNRRCSDRG